MKTLERARAVRFIVLLGVVSLFADMTYESARSITGPYLGWLGASATMVATVAGLGELVGYALRFLSGRLSDKTRAYWPITILGYAINLAAVPLLSVAGRWQIAALLIVLERAGKALRSPARDAMLSNAAHRTGLGWGFGLHEAMDQIGALVGPLFVAAALARKTAYPSIFGWLVIPATLCFVSLLIARFEFPNPAELEASEPQETIPSTTGYPRSFWLYLIGASLVAAGYADFALIAFHLTKAAAVSPSTVPLLYALAMIIEAVSALALGRLFDRIGLKSIAFALALSAFFSLFVFRQGHLWIVLGITLWGVGMGTQNSVMRAALAKWIPKERRATAYGLFNSVYGLAWFAGSLAMGFLYESSLSALVAFSIACQLLAIPFLLSDNR